MTKTLNLLNVNLLDQQDKSITIIDREGFIRKQRPKDTVTLKGFFFFLITGLVKSGQLCRNMIGQRGCSYNNKLGQT